MLNRWQSTIVDAQGNIQPFATLTVLNEETQASAQIYASESESQPLPAGAVVADESGYAYFYARGGRYRIQSADLNIDWRHVPLGELAGMDVADLGLGSAATRDVGTVAGTVAAGDDSRITGAMQKSANLADVDNAETARDNLGLGSAATLDVATTQQADDLIDDGVVITPKKLGDSMSAHVLGMGQTWQTVNRSMNTTYTNTSGRTIVLSVIGFPNYQSGSITVGILVNGELRFSGGSYGKDSNHRLGVTAIIPNGATYRIEASRFSLDLVSELR